MDTSFTIRHYEKGDEYCIYELVNEVWGDKHKLPRKIEWIKGWRWMFMDNPFGGSVINLAFEKDKLVGLYPILKMNICIKNSSNKIGQLADTMTHPKHRRKGIGLSLGKKSITQLIEQGTPLAFCFPTKGAYRLHKKHGWVDLCYVQTMIKPLNLVNIFKSFPYLKILGPPKYRINQNLKNNNFTRNDSKSLGKIVISQISRFDSRFNLFNLKLAKEYSIFIERNQEYLNWRYVENPMQKYIIFTLEIDSVLSGYIILERKIIDKLVFGRILDITCYPNKNYLYQALIKTAIEYFRKEKVDAIFTGIVGNTNLHGFLKDGFLPYKPFSNHFIIYNTQLNILSNYIYNPRQWYIQLGDLPMIF